MNFLDFKDPEPNLEKPFSIKAFNDGAEFCCRSGSRVRVLCTDLEVHPIDREHPKNVAIAVSGMLVQVDENGVHGFNGEDSNLDVFEVKTKEVINA